MVVINTIIGIFFKFPLSFISILNAYATYYFKDYKMLLFKPAFGEFYLLLLKTGVYSLIINLSDFLYIFSISIQIFIYIRFDKKFKSAFDRLLFNEDKNKKK